MIIRAYPPWLVNIRRQIIGLRGLRKILSSFDHDVGASGHKESEKVRIIGAQYLTPSSSSVHIP